MSNILLLLNVSVELSNVERVCHYRNRYIRPLSLLEHNILGLIKSTKSKSTVFEITISYYILLTKSHVQPAKSQVPLT